MSGPFQPGDTIAPKTRRKLPTRLTNARTVVAVNPDGSVETDSCSGAGRRSTIAAHRLGLYELRWRPKAGDR